MCPLIQAAQDLYHGFGYILETWNIGIILLFTVIATAFLGYVLPWDHSEGHQSSLTSSQKSIHWHKPSEWTRGGFSADKATCTWFFAFHFTLPFTITARAVTHLTYYSFMKQALIILQGSHLTSIYSIPSLLHGQKYTRCLTIILILLILVLFSPGLLRDPDNYTPANCLNIAPHIKPEWQFLFTCAIQPSITN